MRRAFEVGEGLALLGTVAGVLAYVFPIHERFYAWPYPALVGFAFANLLAVVVAVGLLAPRPRTEASA